MEALLFLLIVGALSVVAMALIIVANEVAAPYVMIRLRRANGPEVGLVVAFILYPAAVAYVASAAPSRPWFGLIVLQFVILGAVIVLARRAGRPMPSLRIPHSIDEVALVGSLLVLATILVVAAGVFLLQVYLEVADPSISAGSVTARWFSLVGLGPVLEEFFLRGYMQRRLQRDSQEPEDSEERDDDSGGSVSEEPGGGLIGRAKEWLRNVQSINLRVVLSIPLLAPAALFTLVHGIRMTIASPALDFSIREVFTVPEFYVLPVVSFALGMSVGLLYRWTQRLVVPVALNSMASVALLLATLGG